MKQTRLLARRGFTLLELLVAMAVTSIIVTVLIGLTSVAVDAWKESSDQTRASRVAKEMVDNLAKDLEGIVIRRDNDYEWAFARMETNSDLGPSGSSAELMNPLELVFFTGATDRYEGEVGTEKDLGGDISTVSYRLVYRDQMNPSGAEFPVFTVYRRLINPDETYQKFLAQNDIQTVHSTDADQTIEQSNFLVENVYDLTITFKFEYVDVNGITRIVRVPVVQSDMGTDGIRIKGNTIQVNGQPLKGESDEDISANARLAGADLSITVITDAGMNALNRRSLTSDEDVAAFLEENTYHYSKSVILPRP